MSLFRYIFQVYASKNIPPFHDDSFQLVLGLPLEKMHGWWRVMIIYLAGVMAGSLTFTLIHPFARAVGASAGVYSLITAHIANALFNCRELKFSSNEVLGFVFFALCTLEDTVQGVQGMYLDNSDR